MLNLLAILTIVSAVTEPEPWHKQTADLGDYICGVDHRNNQNPRLWFKQDTCTKYADAFLKASAKYNVDLALLMAVAYIESDMRGTRLRDGGDDSYDIGLMGIHCELGEYGKCTNSWVKGETIQSLLKPSVNIDYGAKILSLLTQGYYDKRCDHVGHPAWAHYNWGSKDLSETHILYPRNVQAVRTALAYKIRGDTSNLDRITVATSKRIEKTIRSVLIVAVPGEPESIEEEEN